MSCIILPALILGQEIHSTIFRDDKTFEVSKNLVLKNPTKEVIEEPASQTFDRLLRESFDLRFKESQSILPIENIISKSTPPTPMAFNIIPHAQNGYFVEGGTLIEAFLKIEYYKNRHLVTAC